MSAGPRDTLVVHFEDTREYVSGNPAVEEVGCCGVPGREGPNTACTACGAVVATLFAECYGAYETHFLPDTVRVVGL